MPRFSLRTLIVVMLLGGPLCALGWWYLEPLAFVLFTLAAAVVSVLLALVILHSYIAVLKMLAWLVNSVVGLFMKRTNSEPVTPSTTCSGDAP